MPAYTEEYVQELQAENERLRTLVDSLKAESEAQVANLASLYVAVTSVHGALDRPAVLSSVQEIVTNLIGSEEMAIFETDAAHGRLTLLASIGIEPGPYQEVDIGEGAIGRAAETGERLIRQEGGSLTEDGDAALTACLPLNVGRPRRRRARRVQTAAAQGHASTRSTSICSTSLAAHAASALLFTRLYAASDGMVGAPA